MTALTFYVAQQPLCQSGFNFFQAIQIKEINKFANKKNNYTKTCREKYCR